MALYRFECPTCKSSCAARRGEGDERTLECHCAGRAVLRGEAETYDTFLMVRCEELDPDQDELFVIPE